MRQSLIGDPRSRQVARFDLQVAAAFVSRFAGRNCGDDHSILETSPRIFGFGRGKTMICDVYVNLDVTAEDASACEGRVRVASFGAVKLTETAGFPQRFTRRKSHLATLDKDCFYMQFLKRGVMQIVQRNSTVVSHPGAGCLISASDPYDAIYRTKAEAFYLELPREPFLARFPADARPAPNTVLRTGSGMGRIAAEFCDALAKESKALPEPIRVRLGEQVMDVLALALEGCTADGAETSVRHARLRSIKAFIDENLANPSLSLELDREAQRCFSQLSAPPVQGQRADRVGMDLAQATAALLRDDHVAGPRANVDHRHRVFDGFQQFVALQHLVPRDVRNTAIGLAQAKARRTRR